jgi:Domain of unknown function (DUF4082)
VRRLSLLLPLAIVVAGCSAGGPTDPSPVANQARLAQAGPEVIAVSPNGKPSTTPVNLNGLVANLAGTADSFSFVVDGQQVHGDASTAFFGGSTFSDVVNGARIVVLGVWQGAAVYANRIHVTGAPVSAASTPTPAPAPTPVPAFSIGPTPGLVSCESYTCGFSFTPAQSILVTDLGQWDQTLAGLGSSSPVGLWTATGTLVASATVPAGTTASLVGAYRYVAIAPVALQAGQTYVIASAYQANVAPVADPSGFDPSVAPGSGLFALSGGGILAFPSMTFSSLLAGANFQFVPATTTTASVAVCARPGACR